MPERIAEVGYINEDREHALVSIFEPAILNPGKDSVQVAISIKGARDLKAHLDRFLIDHDRSLQ